MECDALKHQHKNVNSLLCDEKFEFIEEKQLRKLEIEHITLKLAMKPIIQTLTLVQTQTQDSHKTTRKKRLHDSATQYNSPYKY
jgi:hypothetical protein